MTGRSTKIGRLVESKRLQNSTNGNPIWALTMEDGSSWRTARDSSAGYEYSDSEFLGKRVALTIDHDFRVKGIEVLPEQPRTITTLDRLHPPQYLPANESGYFPGDPRMAVTVRSIYGGSTVVIQDATSYQDALRQALEVPFEVWMSDEARDDYGV